MTRTGENGLPRWYALYLWSRFEKKVSLELQQKRIECFLPLVAEMRTWSDRRKRIQEPLFRGYVFVRTDLSNKLDILKTDGVVRFIGVRNHPSPIPDEQINWIRIIINHPAKVHREQYLSVGERVRVIAGDFKGVEGIITRLKGSTRVVISLDAIAQAVSVEIFPDLVEALPSSGLGEPAFRIPAMRGHWKSV